MGTQRYSPECKQTVGEELLAGAKRPGQRCRAQGIDVATWRQWRKQDAQHGLGAGSPPGAKTAPSAQDKSAEVERLVGPLTGENMVRQKALQQARSLSASSRPSSPR
jgi:transposase-like protein